MDTYHGVSSQIEDSLACYETGVCLINRIRNEGNHQRTKSSTLHTELAPWSGGGLAMFVDGQMIE